MGHSIRFNRIYQRFILKNLIDIAPKFLLWSFQENIYEYNFSIKELRNFIDDIENKIIHFKETPKYSNLSEKEISVLKSINFYSLELPEKMLLLLELLKEEYSIAVRSKKSGRAEFLAELFGGMFGVCFVICVVAFIIYVSGKDFWGTIKELPKDEGFQFGVFFIIVILSVAPIAVRLFKYKGYRESAMTFLKTPLGFLSFVVFPGFLIISTFWLMVSFPSFDLGLTVKIENVESIDPLSREMDEIAKTNLFWTNNKLINYRVLKLYSFNPYDYEDDPSIWLVEPLNNWPEKKCDNCEKILLESLGDRQLLFHTLRLIAIIIKKGDQNQQKAINNVLYNLCFENYGGCLKMALQHSAKSKHIESCLKIILQRINEIGRLNYIVYNTVLKQSPAIQKNLERIIGINLNKDYNKIARIVFAADKLEKTIIIAIYSPILAFLFFWLGPGIEYIGSFGGRVRYEWKGREVGFLGPFFGLVIPLLFVITLIAAVLGPFMVLFDSLYLWINYFRWLI